MFSFKINHSDHPKYKPCENTVTGKVSGTLVFVFTVLLKI